MNPHIFREYDIRGVADADLTDDVARSVGRAFAARLREAGGRTCLLGWDMRTSSPRLREAILEGLLAGGVDTVRIGLVPTPVLYFGIHALQADGGIMVTGSHNPPDQNGFKLCLGPGALYGREIQILRMRIEAGDFPRAPAGRVEDRDLLPGYLQMVLDRCRPSRRLKVVLDCGNGAGGVTAPSVFQALGHDVVTLYEEPDGRFPNHQADPTVPALMEDLRQKVLAENADIGIGFDGDADRIGVVDEEGILLYGDQLLALFAIDLLGRHPGEKVIFDVKCSQAVEDVILAGGGVPVMSSTGHSILKARLREEGALLAGEMSGHIFFAENFFGHDDAVYAGALMASILARKGEKLSSMRQSLPAYRNSPEIRVACPDDAKFRVVADVGRRLAERFPVITIDGVRARVGSGFGLLRASNTQPVLVLRFEAATDGDLAAIERLFREELARHPEVPADWDAGVHGSARH